jgi:hypothetical protein
LVEAPCDDQGHGSHTVGTMLGTTPQGRVLGVAPEAKWIGCRNMEDLILILNACNSVSFLFNNLFSSLGTN